MTDQLHPALQQAQAIAEEDPGHAVDLGLVLLTGFARVRLTEKFSSDANVSHVYHTTLPMDDGQWELTLARKPLA